MFEQSTQVSVIGIRNGQEDSILYEQRRVTVEIGVRCSTLLD
jgi:hypothetical protein